MGTTYKWYEVYKAALLETDWSKMENRLGDAEAAIRDRKREFNLNHGGTPEENQALADALHSLGALRVEAAAWSRHKSQEPEKAS